MHLTGKKILKLSWNKDVAFLSDGECDTLGWALKNYWLSILINKMHLLFKGVHFLRTPQLTVLSGEQSYRMSGLLGSFSRCARVRSKYTEKTWVSFWGQSTISMDSRCSLAGTRKAEYPVSRVPFLTARVPAQLMQVLGFRVPE